MKSICRSRKFAKQNCKIKIKINIATCQNDVGLLISRMIAFSFAFDYWWSSIEFMSFTNWLHELASWAGFMNWLLESTSPLNAIQHDSCGRFDAESKVSRSHSKWFKVIQSSSFHAVQMPGDGGRMLKLADQRAAAKFRPHTVLLHTGPYYTHN